MGRLDGSGSIDRLKTLENFYVNVVKLFLGVAVFALLFMKLISGADFLGGFRGELVLVLGFGAIAAIFLSLRPVVLLWFTTALTLVLAGSVRYFSPQFGHIWWLTYGAAFLLYIPPIMHWLGEGTPRKMSRAPLFTGATFALLMIGGLSTVASVPSAGQLLLTVKSWLMVGGIWAFFAVMPLSSRVVRTWITGLFWIGLIQCIPAAYQFFVVRRFRVATIDQGVDLGSADAVVGTFGGDPYSGGLSAVLAFFLVGSIAMVMAFRKEGFISRLNSLMAVVVLTVPLVMAEVKVIFVFLPIALTVIYSDEVMRKPLLAAVGIVFMGGLLGAMLYAYQQLHWASHGGDLKENATDSLTYSFESGTNGESLTRLGVIQYWWDHHSLSEPVSFLIGHGGGASRTKGNVIGNAAIANDMLNIDRTGLGVVLWDFGLLGAVSVFAMFLGAFRSLSKIRRSQKVSSWNRALANGLRALVPLMVLSMYYRSDIPYAPPMMFLAMASLGLLAWLMRQDEGKVIT